MAAEDLHSRRIVGWPMSERIDSRLVVHALEMAIARRLPAARLLAHSGRGSPYASAHDPRRLARHGISCSMSRRANGWDNAPVESVLALRKEGQIHGAEYATREEARASILESIAEFSNRGRQHSALDDRSPDEYERAG